MEKRQERQRRQKRRVRFDGDCSYWPGCRRDIFLIHSSTLQRPSSASENGPFHLCTRLHTSFPCLPCHPPIHTHCPPRQVNGPCPNEAHQRSCFPALCTRTPHTLSLLCSFLSCPQTALASLEDASQDPFRGGDDTRVNEDTGSLGASPRSFHSRWPRSHSIY